MIPESLYKLLSTKRPSNDNRVVKWFNDFLSEYCDKPFNVDKHGNYWLKVGDNPKHAFTSHYDTVHRSNGPQPNAVLFDTGTNIISTKSGKKGTPLGADDGAGIYIMLELIKAGKDGYYFFFSDEEIGGKGSSKFQLPTDIDIMISLDRQGYNEVIIGQGCGQCASDQFGQWLADSLNFENPVFDFKTSHLGTFTDSANFIDDIPECVNLAVGYENQHTKYEILDLEFLNQLLYSLMLIEFNKAPIVGVSDRWSYDDNENELDWVADNADYVLDYLDTLGIELREIKDFKDQLSGRAAKTPVRPVDQWDYLDQDYYSSNYS